MASAAAPGTPGSGRKAGRAQQLLNMSRIRDLSGGSVADFDAMRLPEFAMKLQLESLQKRMPRGLYLLADEDDAMRWHGVIMVPRGMLYGGCVATFLVDVPRSFPSDGAMPEVTFLKFPRHPLIMSESGKFALAHFIPEWKQSTELYQVLKAVKAAFAPTKTELAGLMESPCFEDIKTMDAMSKDLPGFKAEIASLAGPQRQALLQPPVTAAAEPLDPAGRSERAKGRDVFPSGGFRFTAPAPEHAKLLEFIRTAPGGKPRPLRQMAEAVASLEAGKEVGPPTGPQAAASSSAAP